MDSNPFEPLGLQAVVIAIMAVIIVCKVVFWLGVGAFVLRTGRLPDLIQKLYLARHPRLAPQKHEHKHVHVHEEHFYLHSE